MHAKYSQTNGLVRVYTEGHDYVKRNLYIGVMSVFWLDDETAYLFGALANTTHNIRQCFRPVFTELKAVGATKIRMKRSKGRKMPFGKVIASEEFEDMWEVDLSIIKKGPL